MWTRFGQLPTQVIAQYPVPRYDRIREPFCGTARFSLYWHLLDVHINDLDNRIYRLWKYLQKAKKADILGLPDMSPGEEVRRNPFLRREEQDLMLYESSVTRASPGDTAGLWCDRWSRRKLAIARQLHKIKKWDITNFDYRQLPDEECTWFIDGPWQRSRHRYPCDLAGKKAFRELGEWCASRKGQVIIREREGADWIPPCFKRGENLVRWRLKGELLREAWTECYWYR